MWRRSACAATVNSHRKGCTRVFHWSGAKLDEVSLIDSNHKVDTFCENILNAMNQGRWKIDEAYQARGHRKEMVQPAHAGHIGEQAWATMNLDGCECVSSGVHVLGFFVGYAGYNGNRQTMTPSRLKYVNMNFDREYQPSFLKEIPVDTGAL